MNIQVQKPGVRFTTTLLVGLTSLTNWALARYVFKGSEPGWVSGEVAIAVPALVAYIGTHIALMQPPPNATVDVPAEAAPQNEQGGGVAKT